MPMFGFGFGRGPRRRGGGFPLVFLFFLIFIFPDFIYLFGSIIPLVILTIWGIIKLINLFIKKKNNNKTRSEIYQDSAKVKNNYDLSKIDKKLNNYFKNNVALPIVDDISLIPNKGKYTSIDQLYLTYKDEKIVKLGEFKEEHFGMYDKIVSLLEEFSKQSDKIMKTKVETPEVKKEDILSNAQLYINRINELNAAIPQEEITNGLYQTCDLLKQIELSKQSKQDEQKLNKLYDYYLPILTGILENYKNLQNRAIKDEEFNKCEAQLIKTIMLINQALKTLYGEMHEDDYLNINADMDTLQTLIKKDGYDKDPFKVEEK